ncbi:MAG: hypothetical protein ACI4HI_17025 [Lachnospiraceae bacterium]
MEQRIYIQVMQAKKTKDPIWIKVLFMPRNVYSELEDFVLTPYDLAVMDAAFTLAEYKCWDFTLEFLVQVIKGDLQKPVTEKEKKEAKASIEKLRAVRCNIDCSEEWRVRKKEGKGLYMGSLLPVTDIQWTPAYHRIAKPGYHMDTQNWSLYQYAKEIKQIIAVPFSFYHLPNMTVTQDIIKIRNYLCRRIAVMGHKKNKMKSRRIIYCDKKQSGKEENGLFPNIGYDREKRDTYKNWRKEKSKHHQRICSILDHFQKEGFIKGYALICDEYTGGRKAIRGIEIL